MASLPVWFHNRARTPGLRALGVPANETWLGGRPRKRGDAG